MKIVKFETKDSRDMEETKISVIKELKTATNFVFCFSDDNLNTIYKLVGNLTALEILGVLDIVKHSSLHGVLPDDDDGDREEILLEGEG